jgi:hypothetical protein
LEKKEKVEEGMSRNFQKKPSELLLTLEKLTECHSTTKAIVQCGREAQRVFLQ